MSLTKTDLKAIQNIVGSSIDRRVPSIVNTEIDNAVENRIRPMFEEFEERFGIKAENGFQEIRDQLYRLQNTVDSIERVQMAELERDDKQDLAIKQIRKALHAA